MKKLLILSILLFVNSCLAAANCMGSAKTQLEMNQCAQKTADKLNDQLEVIYQQALKQIKSDKIAYQALIKSQQAWLAYRKAELDMHYPHKEDMLEHYGSIWPICFNDLYAQLTNARIKSLKQWLQGPEEGDPCR